jgi:hypothetical protein
MPTLNGAVGKGQSNQLADARLVQQLLNRYRPAGSRLLRVDGVIGQNTISAIEEFQTRVEKFAHPDGIVSPQGKTFKALCGGKTDVVRIAWGAKVDAGFKRKAIAICDLLSMPVDFLMSAMAFESGESFSPSVKNAAGSGATGLIQFMPSTAKGLGTTTDKLAAMSAVEQLDFVQKYFAPRRGSLRSLEDVYMAILYPAAIGLPSTSTLFAEGTTAYKQNKGLDANRDGTISVHEAAAKVQAKFQKGIQAGYLG